MPETLKKQGAVKKRQQIQDSSKTMFLWVAGMSVIVGFALVVSWFLFQQIQFKSKVVSAKAETASVLADNIEAAQDLRENIRVLETNTALNSVKADDDDKALQVILDALPSDGNSLALGASLQQRLARGINGLTIDTLTITPSSTEQSEDSGGQEAIEGEINFRMIATASNINAHRDLLERFESSIRVIDIDNLRLERAQNNYTMTLEAHGYYQPAKQIELTEEKVRP